MTGWSEKMSTVREHLVRVAEDLFVSAIVAAAVSACLLVYFEGRLENSKTHVETLIASQQKFDDAHNDVLSQFGLYANKLLSDKRVESQHEKIYAAIINAQSQLLQLHHELGDQNNRAISDYASELNALSDALEGVTHGQQLGPAYDHVQRLLAEREAVDDSVTKNLHITAF